MSFQHRRPPEALRAALIIPRAHTEPTFPEFTGEECLKQHGRDGNCARLASNDTLNEQGESSSWCCITYMGERLLVTLMSVGSLFSAETTLQTGIGLSDEFCSINSTAFLSEGRKFQLFWRTRFERHFLASLTRPRLYLKDLYSTIWYHQSLAFCHILGDAKLSFGLSADRHVPGK